MSKKRTTGTISFIVDKNGCWIWQRSIISTGYGHFRLNGKNILAHRYMYELLKGKIPPSCEIDHLCRNRKCINPAHLEAVSHAENCYRGKKSILSRHKAKQARKMRMDGMKVNDIAKHFNVERHAITSLLNGRAWTK